MTRKKYKFLQGDWFLNKDPIHFAKQRRNDKIKKYLNHAIAITIAASVGALLWDGTPKQAPKPRMRHLTTSQIYQNADTAPRPAPTLIPTPKPAPAAPTPALTQEETPAKQASDNTPKQKTIYKWFDEKGRAHYSDTGQPENATPTLSVNETTATRSANINNATIINQARQKEDTCKYWRTHALDYPIETVDENIKKYCRS